MPNWSGNANLHVFKLTRGWKGKGDSNYSDCLYIICYILYILPNESSKVFLNEGCYMQIKMYIITNNLSR